MKREKGKAFYSNQWKGILNKLDEITLANPEMSYEDIVRQSIEKGYASLYPLNNSYIKKSSSEEGVKSEHYTEEDLEELDRLSKEREKNGKKAYF